MQQIGESIRDVSLQLIHLIRFRPRALAPHFQVFDREKGTCQNIQLKTTGSPRINPLDRVKKRTRYLGKSSNQLPVEGVAWTLLFCSRSRNKFDDT
ncbi:hypothetical protein HMPREF2944_03120 [Rothia sp. HMSC072E10]|nr:hypothetical protein HMPREF2944_03120 [Rothia sp. HMSC072E10]